MRLHHACALVALPALLGASDRVSADPASPAKPRPPSAARPAPKPAITPVLKAAPAFTLTDADGVKHALADYRGRPVALFFFCGCPWCTRCAHDWGQFQRGGALPGQSPVTLVVFSGDASAARDFALSTGLDAQTVLLPDTRMHVTLDLYDAEPCPRVFVLDAQGRQRYTNDHKDDAPRQAPEMVIASRALDALRACAAPTPPGKGSKFSPPSQKP